MFEDSDFNIFNVDSLEGRMQLIKTVIDLKFELAAKAILPILNASGQTWYAHVAKHLRRTTNAPDNTWVAFSPNKRGYKMMPHFELGIWSDHVYIYLAVEENMKPKHTVEAVEKLLTAQTAVSELPSDFVISLDHMVNVSHQLSVTAYGEAITRFSEIKHSEILIGMKLSRGDSRFESGKDLLAITEVIENLLPIYEIIK